MRASPILVLLGFCFLANTAKAAEESRYENTDKPQCRVWNESPKPQETVTWDGQCKDGYAEGQGTTKWFENRVLVEVSTGVYRDGFQNGQGSTKKACPSNSKNRESLIQGYFWLGGLQGFGETIDCNGIKRAGMFSAHELIASCASIQ